MVSTLGGDDATFQPYSHQVDFIIGKAFATASLHLVQDVGDALLNVLARLL